MSEAINKTNREDLMTIFRAVFFVFISMLVTTAVNGQERTTKIRIKLETQIVGRDYRIKLYTGNKEIEPLHVDGGIRLPENFEKEKEICVKFSSGEYTLDFGPIDVSDFKTDWEIGIDYDPFEKSNVGHLPGESRIGPGLLYYIMFFQEDGTVKYKKTIIDRSYKKP
jgi:hypothetical protein